VIAAGAASAPPPKAPAAAAAAAKPKRTNKKASADFVERPSKAQPSPVDTMVMEPGVTLKAPDGSKAGPKPHSDPQHKTRAEWRAYCESLRRGTADKVAAAQKQQQQQQQQQQAQKASREQTPGSPAGTRSGVPAGPTAAQVPGGSQPPAIAGSVAASAAAERQQPAEAKLAGGATPPQRAAASGNAPQRADAAAVHGGKLQAPLRRATNDLPDWISQGKPKLRPAAAGAPANRGCERPLGSTGYTQHTGGKCKPGPGRAAGKPDLHSMSASGMILTLCH
jgi:hypothetical protein